MSYWDKILESFSYKSKGGAPDFSNPNDRLLLRMELLKRGWNEGAVNELMYRLTENTSKEQNDYLKSFGEFPWGKDGNKIFLTTALNYASSKDFQLQQYKQVANEKAKQFLQKRADVGSELAKSILQVDDPKKKVVKKKVKKEKEIKPKPLKKNELKNTQEKTSDDRDKGTAGAGGQAASQGESRYCSAVDEMKLEDELNGVSQEEVNAKKSKGLSKPEKDTLKSLGFEEPYDDNAHKYLIAREKWAEREYERIKNKKPYKIPNPSPPPKTIGNNVLMNSDGFNGDKKGYLEWMRAAFDGAVATQALLKESSMDTTQGTQTVQSTTEVDDKVLADLMHRRDSYPEGSAERKHYDGQIKRFSKNRKYHDTYVVGKDADGLTVVVSVSNKKDSQLKDPQNNTTPAQRFEVIKEKFGSKVAKGITDTIDRGIKIVTEVQKVTIKKASEHEVDDDFVHVADIVAPKYLYGSSSEMGVVKRGLKRSRGKEKILVKDKDGNLVEKNKPHPAARFGCWLEDKGITPQQWESMSTKDKLKWTQKYMADTDYHEKTGPPPYAIAKVWIKVGEASQGGRGIVGIRSDSMMKTLEKHNPKLKSQADKNLKALEKKLKPKKPTPAQKEATIKEVYDQHKAAGGKKDPLDQDEQSSSVSSAGVIKTTEAGSINKAHRGVRNKIASEDQKLDYPKRDKEGKIIENGPNAKAYINTVLDALHYNSYIDADDDEGMIIQMGSRSAKPSHIRKCLAEMVGEPELANNPEELKKRLQNTCELGVREEGAGINGAIVIVNRNKVLKDKDGNLTYEKKVIANDSWRTAGTSQKVASGHGDDMRECLKEKIDADAKERKSKTKKSKAN